MASAKEQLSLVIDGMEDKVNVSLKERPCAGGMVEVSGRFRLKKSEKEVKEATAQDALPIQNKLKPTIKAKFSDCKAKNPMRCRFHGAFYAKNQLKALCDMLGIDGDSLDVKRIDEGMYDFMVKVPSSKINEFKEGYEAFLADNGLEDYGASKDDGYYSFMYAAEEELDPKELDEVETLKVDFGNAEKSVEELSGLKGMLSADDLEALNSEISNQQERVKDMDETLEMLGAKNEEEIDDIGFENESQAEGMPTLPPLPNDLSELTLVKKDIGGSTGPSLWKDANGNKFILKTGGTAGGDPEGHVKNEYYGLKAYRAMGVFAPDAKLFTDKNGKTVMVENFVEGVPLGEFLDNATAAQDENIRKQIQDTSFADIVLGNWDCAGTYDATAGDYPNMFVVNGKLCRIDPGGWGRYRAQGALKNDEDWNDGSPNELFSMKRVGTSADFLKDMSFYDLAQQIDAQDYSALLDTVPNADKAVLKKRIDAIRKIAERGRNYVEDGKYANKDFVDMVLEMSHEMTKNGAVESLSYAPFTFETLKPDSMKYSAEQTTGVPEIDEKYARIESLQKDINVLKSATKFKFDETENAIIQACDDVVDYMNTGMADVEPQSVDIAIAKEGSLKFVESELKKTISALETNSSGGMFASLTDDILNVSKRKLSFVQSALKGVEAIKKWKSDHYSQSSPIVDFDYTNEKDFVLDDIPETEYEYLIDAKDKAKVIAKLKSDVADLHDEISAKRNGHGIKPLVGLSPMDIIEMVSMEFAQRIGRDSGNHYVKSMMDAQGYNAWPKSEGYRTESEAYMAKIAELEALGIDWRNEKPTEESISNIDPSISHAERNQYFKTHDGELVYAGTWEYHRNAFNGQMEKDDEGSSAYLFNETINYLKNEPDEFKESMIAYAAMKAVQSLTFENTKFEGADKSHVAVTRTLDKGFCKKYNLYVGKYNFYPSGTSESAAYGKVTEVSPTDMSVQVRVPVSRLTGMFCWDDSYDHKGENEFGVNLAGLPQYVCNTGDINPYGGRLFDNLNKFLQDNPKPTESNSHKYKSPYLT